MVACANSGSLLSLIAKKTRLCHQVDTFRTAASFVEKMQFYTSYAKLSFGLEKYSLPAQLVARMFDTHGIVVVVIIFFNY